MKEARDAVRRRASLRTQQNSIVVVSPVAADLRRQNLCERPKAMRMDAAIGIFRTDQVLRHFASLQCGCGWCVVVALRI